MPWNALQNISLRTVAAFLVSLSQPNIFLPNHFVAPVSIVLRYSFTLQVTFFSLTDSSMPLIRSGTVSNARSLPWKRRRFASHPRCCQRNKMIEVLGRLD